MRNALVWASVAVWLAGAVPAAAVEHSADERNALTAAILQWRSQHVDAAAISAKLKTIVENPAFPSLTERERHVAYLLYGVALYDQHRNADAQLPLMRASELPDATQFDWGLRFENAFILDDYRDAAQALTMLASRWPAKLSEYRENAIIEVATKIQKPPGSRLTALPLLTALFANWQPREPFSSADDLWMSLLRLRLEQGDVGGAGLVAKRIRSPWFLLQMRADKRFDALVAADPGLYDVMKAFEAILGTMKADAAAAPDKLDGPNDIAHTLSDLGRPQEALAVLDDALARAGATPQPFSDYDDQINWSHDNRAHALFFLGRTDEGYAAYLQGAAYKERGKYPNVSQPINLAEEYYLHDRPEDVLKTLAALNFTDASPYGRLAIADARACAYFALGDKAKLDETLSYIRAHSDDGMQPYLNTMLTVGDLHAVAAEVIARLKDPERRMRMLQYLQNYMPEPNDTARQRAVHAAWIAARSRPDVAAEIAKVGRIESYPIVTPGY